MKNAQNNPFRILCDTWLARIGSVHAWFWLGLWVMMGVVAVAAFVLARRRRTVYGAVILGITVFCGLFLLETTVVLRCCNLLPYFPGQSFRVALVDLFNGSKARRTELFSNFAVFVPFGICLAESLATAKRRFGFWRRIGLATLGGFALSLCVECLQWVLGVGFFELTDLVLNTLGSCAGALLAAAVRALFRKK